MDIKMAFKAYAWSLFLHETMFMTSLLISAEKIMLLYLEDYGLKWEMNTWNLWNEAPVIMQMSEFCNIQARSSQRNVGLMFSSFEKM